MNREWTFRSEVVRPDGVQVVVMVSVPEGLGGDDVLEISEHAQMATVRLQSSLIAAEKSDRSRVFTREVPF